MNPKELLRLSHVAKIYPDGKEVLKDINLAVCEGDFVTVMGKSGCGKSTMLNIIGLLDHISSGEYYFKGCLVSRPKFGMHVKIRADEIGFVFQSYCLLENLSVQDNALLPFLYNNHKINRLLMDNLERYMEIFGLLECRNKKVKLLSGGEKQRVAIIRALIKNPSLIVADEPTGNLDPENSKIICRELQQLSEMGKAVIVVTHNQEVFQNIGKMYTLEEGVLISHEQDHVKAFSLC